jgi:hypothetical protein
MREDTNRGEYQRGGKERAVFRQSCAGKLQRWEVLDAGVVDVKCFRLSVAFVGLVRELSRWVGDYSAGARSRRTCFFGVECWGSEQIRLR